MHETSGPLLLLTIYTVMAAYHQQTTESLGYSLAPRARSNVQFIFVWLVSTSWKKGGHAGCGEQCLSPNHAWTWMRATLFGIAQSICKTRLEFGEDE